MRIGGFCALEASRADAIRNDSGMAEVFVSRERIAERAGRPAEGATQTCESNLDTRLSRMTILQAMPIGLNGSRYSRSQMPGLATSAVADSPISSPVRTIVKLPSDSCALKSACFAWRMTDTPVPLSCA